MSKPRNDPRGLPMTAGAIPDYTHLARAIDQFPRHYQQELQQRRRERVRSWIEASRGRRAAAALAARAVEARAALLKALGGFEPTPALPGPELLAVTPLSVAGPPARGSHGESQVGLVVRRHRLAGAGRPVPLGPRTGGPQDLEFLEIRNRGQDSAELVLLIGDAEAHLIGGQSPETVAAAWGYRLAAAGYAVVIPDLPSLRGLSATRSKALLVQGSCAPAEIIDEAERVLTAALAGLRGIDRRRAWLAGAGLGGLAAIMLAALDGRAFGCIAIDAPRPGDLDCDDALTMPAADLLTDMADVAAAAAPAALALVQAGVSPWGPADGSPAWVDRAAKAARPAGGAYTRIDATADAAAGVDRLIRWMRRRSADAGRRPAAADGRPARLPRRTRRDTSVSIAAMSSLLQWQRKRTRLRRTFLDLLGLPHEHRPHRVVPVAADELPDCFREEIDVYSAPSTGAKVLVLRPRTPKAAGGPNPVVLCLPGSSSHAGRVEAAYAHEVVARGFTAVIIDSRARLYREFPGARRGRIVVGQSVFDQLCVMDYLVTRPDVDARRIGTMGLSQGGIHSWMLAALDERIAAAAPVCGLSTFRATIEDVRDDWYDGSCLSFLDSHTFYVYPPGLLRHADVGDLMGLIAPRPLAILGGTHDHVFPLRGIRRIHRELRHLYGLYGAADKLACRLIDAKHSMPPVLRLAAYAFFEKHL